MADIKRIVVVRRGATELFERLRRRYGAEPATLIVYDRRSSTRRRAIALVTGDRRRGERRFPDLPHILRTRGYFVARVRPARPGPTARKP